MYLYQNKLNHFTFRSGGTKCNKNEWFYTRGGERGNWIMQNKLLLLLSSKCPSETSFLRITSVVPSFLNFLWSLLIILFIQVFAQMATSPCYTLRSESELAFSTDRDIHAQAPLIMHVSSCCRNCWYDADNKSSRRARHQNILFRQIFAYSSEISSDHFFRLRIIYNYWSEAGKQTQTLTQGNAYILVVYLTWKWLKSN